MDVRAWGLSLGRCMRVWGGVRAWGLSLRRCMKSVASSVSASARPLVRDFPSRSRHSHRTVDGKYSRGIGIVVKSVASSARLRPSLGPGLSHQEADTATGRLDNTGSVGAGWGCHEKCCLRLPASVRALGLGFPNEEEDAGTGRWDNMGSVGAGLECCDTCLLVSAGGYA